MILRSIPTRLALVLALTLDCPGAFAQQVVTPRGPGKPTAIITPPPPSPTPPATPVPTPSPSPPPSATPSPTPSPPWRMGPPRLQPLPPRRFDGLKIAAAAAGSAALAAILLHPRRRPKSP